MRSVRYLAHTLIAVLLLVPAATRAYQRLDPRPDLKPTPSFRDVDRTPDPERGTIDVTAWVFDCEPPRVTIGVVEPVAPFRPHGADVTRCESLRAPPFATAANLELLIHI